VVFRRRKPKSWGAWLIEMVYPQGGFRRATRYVMHRMRRLPDEPHRIARGIFAGSLIGFLPLPGLQFLGAAAFAWAIRGNIFAALLGTFNSNPVTTPFFAVAAIGLGQWMLGMEHPLAPEAIGAAFADAGADLWFNVKALFTHDQAQWAGLKSFWDTIWLPYFIGALGPGVILSLIFYYLTIPLVRAYQKARAATARERTEKRSRLRQTLSEAAQRLSHRADRDGAEGSDTGAPPRGTGATGAPSTGTGGDDDGPGPA
jgi:hypothetical protein